MRLLGSMHVAIGALFASALSGQDAITRVEENLRAAPNGAVLAVVRPGASLAVRERQPPWLLVELEGWMWERSLQARSRGDFDLVISEAGGENLRAEPSGEIIARFASGTALVEVDRRPGWIRVRRSAWMWSESVAVTEQSGRGAADQEDVPSPADQGVDTVASGSQGVAPEEVLLVSGREAALLSAPDGDTVARALASSNLHVTARDGSWARVRIEGWVWAPAGDSAIVPGQAEPALPAQVLADPARYLGQVVRWELQFISLERASAVRTDFAAGEQFLLARTTDGDRFFIYVVVPPDRLAEVARLLPLERIRVVGRVRTGASPLTGSPIIDLLELQGRRSAPQRE
jgi:hypothetical protein